MILTAEELKQYAPKKNPLILTRITVILSDLNNAFLHVTKNALQQYDLIAFTPTSEAAYKKVFFSSDITLKYMFF